MTLTYNEEQRILNIESKLNMISDLLTNAASKNMLNKLLTLSNNDIAKANSRLADLEERVEVLVALAQKLQ